MAEYLELTDHLEDVEKWYNAYTFGIDTIIYNPWSIIKYMSMLEDGLKPYLINTCDNRLIKDNPDVAWSFLLHAGYLKACGKEKIRNKYPI